MSTVRHGRFAWDAAKAASNLRKHRVSFEEAAGCFLDPHGLDLADRVHPRFDRLLCREPNAYGRVCGARRRRYPETHQRTTRNGP